LERVNLAGSRFERVDLSGAQLRTVDLTGARFRGVRLHGVVMRGVELVDDVEGDHDQCGCTRGYDQSRTVD
jgi:uncharacterized protein YjbI with pentapeptide repeats